MRTYEVLVSDKWEKNAFVGLVSAHNVVHAWLLGIYWCRSGYKYPWQVKIRRIVQQCEID